MRLYTILTCVASRSIKLSSPKLSNIIAAGCILVYAAVILLGMDYSTLPANEIAFPIICTVWNLIILLSEWTLSVLRLPDGVNDK